MNRKLPQLLLTVASILIGFFVAEMGLRLLGFGPDKKIIVNNPRMMPDGEIGWVPIVSNTSSATSLSGAKIENSTDQLGARICPYDNGDPARPIVLVIGCSFTNGGDYLKNEDTYSCQLQKLFPNLRFVNLGVDAYGSYQSLLLLRRQFSNYNNITAVIYGFVDFHDARNVAHPLWIRGLSSSTKGQVIIPFVQLDVEDRLMEKKPIHESKFSLADYSAFSARLDNLIAGMSRPSRINRLEKVTVRVVEMMMREITARNIKFLPIMLFSANNSKQFYLELFADSGIPMVDCHFDIKGLTPEIYQLAEDQHPNAFLNSYWASCISEFIPRTILQTEYGGVLRGGSFGRLDQ